MKIMVKEGVHNYLMNLDSAEIDQASKLDVFALELSYNSILK